MADQILWSYFGPFGPGLSRTRELGLSWLGPDELTDWAGRYFTSSNAAPALVGKPPDSWGLSLLSGSPMPYRIPERLRPAPTEPTLFETQEMGVTWGALVKDSEHALDPEVYISLDALTQRLQDRLRHELGQVYAVGSGWLRLDGDHVLLSLGFDVDPGQSRKVAGEYHTVITEYLDSGPTTEEIERYVRYMVRNYEDYPLEASRHHVMRAAESVIQEWEEPPGPDAYLDACRTLTPDQFRDRFAEAYRQSLTIADLPPGTLPKLTTFFPISDRAMPGVQFESKMGPKQNQATAIRIGPEGVDFGYADGWMPSPTEDIALIVFDGNQIALGSAQHSMSVDSGKYLQSVHPIVKWSAFLLSIVGFFLIAVNAGDYALFMLVLLVPLTVWVWSLTRVSNAFPTSTTPRSGTAH